MKLREDLTKDFLDNLAGIIDNEGFGYMLLWGGLGEAEPKYMLDNEEDIKKVEEAIDIIREFTDLMPSL